MMGVKMEITIVPVISGYAPPKGISLPTRAQLRPMKLAMSQDPSWPKFCSIGFGGSTDGAYICLTPKAAKEEESAINWLKHLTSEHPAVIAAKQSGVESVLVALWGHSVPIRALANEAGALPTNGSTPLTLKIA
jgi:hypothetical protein